MIRGIIFDFDGTLIDSFSPRSEALKKVAEKIFQILNGEGLRVNMNDLLSEVLSLEDEMNRRGMLNRNLWWKTIFNKYGINVSENELLSLTNIYWSIIMKNQRIYEDTIQSLSLLKEKGFKLALLTDTDGLVGMKLKRIEASGIKHFFDEILIAGEHTKQTKPAPEPFLTILEKLGLDSEYAVYIGDSLATDIAGAKKVNMTAILVLRNRSIPLNALRDEIFPDIIIKDLSTFVKLVC